MLTQLHAALHAFSSPKGVPSSVIGAPCHDQLQKKQEIALSMALGRVKREAAGLHEDRTVKEQHRRGAHSENTKWLGMNSWGGAVGKW